MTYKAARGWVVVKLEPHQVNSVSRSTTFKNRGVVTSTGCDINSGSIVIFRYDGKIQLDDEHYAVHFDDVVAYA